MKKKIRILATGGIVTTFLLSSPVLASQIVTPSALFERSARGDLRLDIEAEFSDTASDFPIYANDDFGGYSGLGDGIGTKIQARDALVDQGFSPSHIQKIVAFKLS